jgi:hypothetical protein
VAPRQLVPRELDRDLEHEVGEGREVVREPLDRQQPGEVLREQAEHLSLVHLAQQHHAPLAVVGVRRELRAQLARERLEIGGA